MTDDAKQERRGRGRPRMSDTEKKRHSMTFRMRTDLRAAVEELAKANGRSMSEQIEYYVESSVSTEVNLIYQYSTDAISPTLLKATRGTPTSSLYVQFAADHRTTVGIDGKPVPIELFKLMNPLDPAAMGLARTVEELNETYNKVSAGLSKAYSKLMTALHRNK